MNSDDIDRVLFHRNTRDGDTCISRDFSFGLKRAC
jgi:hypothetical protein